MKILPLKNCTPIINKTAFKNTRNPLNLYRMMEMYSMERKEKFPRIQAIINCIDSIFHNCKMRVVKDDKGDILASYTYRFCKNYLDERTMFLDALVRNRKKPESKLFLSEVYEDVKNIALSKKVKELNLFSMAKDVNLRKKYEQLGFKIDEKIYIEKAYLMKVNIDDFIKSKN